MKITVSITKGDAVDLEYTVKDSSGTPVDITNYDVYFSVKERTNSASYTLQKTSNPVSGITKTDPTNGVLVVELNHSDTDISVKEYVYDLQLVSVADSEKVYTAVKPSPFKITEEVTT